jgi:hypothetical protein
MVVEGSDPRWRVNRAQPVTSWGLGLFASRSVATIRPVAGLTPSLPPPVVA